MFSDCRSLSTSTRGTALWLQGPSCNFLIKALLIKMPQPEWTICSSNDSRVSTTTLSTNVATFYPFSTAWTATDGIEKTPKYRTISHPITGPVDSLMQPSTILFPSLRRYRLLQTKRRINNITSNSNHQNQRKECFWHIVLASHRCHSKHSWLCSSDPNFEHLQSRFLTCFRAMGNVNRPDCSGVLTSSFVISLHVLQTAAHATTCLRLGHTLSLASTLWITSLNSSGGMLAQQLCSCGASALNCVSSSTIPLDLPRWWCGNFNSKLLLEMFPIPPFSWNSRIKLFRGIMDGFWFDIVVLQVNSNFTSHPSPSDAFLKISTHNFTHLHKLYTVRYTLTNIHTAWLDTNTG